MSDGISIIIPTLNRGAQISASASGFAAVLGPSDELIIVDQTDEPDDQTKNLYRRLLRDDRVRIYYSSIKSSGQARNSGAALANNEILLFWDDDLEPMDDVLEKHRKYHAQLAGEFVGVAGCCEGNYVVHPKGRRRAWNFAAGHVSLQKAAFFEAGGFNQNFIYPFIPEDYELHVRLTARGQELVPALDCRGFHAVIAGLSCNSVQSDRWYAGVVHNHVYSFFHTLWTRRFSPSGILAAAHLIYTLFRYMFPLRLFRFRHLRTLFFLEFAHGWRTFRTHPEPRINQPANEVVEWRERFDETSESD